MKFHKLSCITVLMVAAGFFIPYIMTLFQDQHIEGQINHYELPSVEFGYTSAADEIIDALQLVEHWEKVIELNYYDRTKADEIAEATLETFNFLVDSGIDGIPIETFQAHSAKKFMIVADNSTVGRVFWELCFYDDDVNVVARMILEDNSMKVVTFSFEATDIIVEQSTPYIWARALTEYYGFEESSYEAVEDANGYIIQFSNAHNETVSTYFYIERDGYCTFNI